MQSGEFNPGPWFPVSSESVSSLQQPQPTQGPSQGLLPATVAPFQEADGPMTCLSPSPSAVYLADPHTTNLASFPLSLFLFNCKLLKKKFQKLKE